MRGRSFDDFPGNAYTEEELIELLSGADAVILSPRDRITRRVFEASPDLRIVARPIIGVDGIDIDAANELGALVVNSPAPENYLGVAEATIGLILALVKRLNANQYRLRENRWKHYSSFGTLLAGQKVGIVGLGAIGMNVARRLSSWEVRLIATDPKVEESVARAVGARLVDLDTLLSEADVATIHVTLNEHTRHLISETELRKMKQSAYLVNTSRGGVIDESALARALQEEWISGAALDVFEQEPLPQDSPLRRLSPERLILTPHSIGNNLALQRTGMLMAVENVLRALRGELPTNVRNPLAVERWNDRFSSVHSPGTYATETKRSG